jgi:anti-sigma factor RsiW
MTNNNDTSKKDDHTRNLWVPFLEGLLDPEDQLRVEKHLQSCPDCAADLEETKQWIGMLTKNEEVFCPEPWELFDRMRTGMAPEREITAHLKKCESCRHAEEAFKAAPLVSGMPDDLWARMQAKSEPDRRASRDDTFARWVSRFVEAISDFFRIPVLATAGAVAAAVLLVVLLYPGTAVHPVVTLSSVQWEGSFLHEHRMGEREPTTPQTPGSTPKEGLTLVLTFANPAQTMPREQIDSLYEEMSPPQGILARYRVVTPKQVKDAVAAGEIHTGTSDELLRGLHDKLAVTKVVLVIIKAQGNQFEIESQLRDTTTGAILKKGSVKGIPDADLGSKVEEACLSVLPPDGKGGQP